MGCISYHWSMCLLLRKPGTRQGAGWETNSSKIQALFSNLVPTTTMLLAVAASRSVLAKPCVPCIVAWTCHDRETNMCMRPASLKVIDKRLYMHMMNNDTLMIV